MKSALILAAMACSLSWAQTTDDCKPNILNIPEAKYPCVHSDNSVTVRVNAPDAQRVRVSLGGGTDLTKGPDNFWSATTKPLVVGFHYYTLTIDGAAVADPATMTFFGSGWQNSGIEIPEPAADSAYYQLQNVPHGHIGQQPYFSKVTEKWRRAYVYTPPDYTTGNKKYPVDRKSVV